jgi:hypothetical protein
MDEIIRQTCASYIAHIITVPVTKLQNVTYRQDRNCDKNLILITFNDLTQSNKKPAVSYYTVHMLDIIKWQASKKNIKIINKI